MSVSSPPPGLAPPDWLQRARMLQRQGRIAEACEVFESAIHHSGNDGERWYEYGYLLKSAGRYEASLQAFGEALARPISRPEEVHLNRAVLFSDHLRRDDDAESELRHALAVSPGYVPALLNLGNLQEERGERQAAIDTYETLLGGAEARDPEHNQLRMEALGRIARMRPPADADDPFLERLREAASTQPNKTVRANLLFALGHSYESTGRYDLAFDAFAKANRWLLRQSGRRYDRRQTEALVDALVQAFREPAAARRSLPSDDRPSPLFICGMFRSGSTLVEQVLGAHARVLAGGELNWLRRLASIDLQPFPQSMAGMTDSGARELAAGYRSHLGTLFPAASGSDYITDKRPDNFLLIGLIKRLFPDAKIVHTVRDPRDTGLSLFSHHLHPQVAAYACELADIGHYYTQYRRLMAHWHALYPADILDFDYDAFVADPQPALRRLLAFLELPWDPDCLEFHTRGGTVKTASYWQIRQPLHAKASGRWRNYGARLDPLRNALRLGGVEA